MGILTINNGILKTDTGILSIKITGSTLNNNILLYLKMDSLSEEVSSNNLVNNGATLTSNGVINDYYYTDSVDDYMKTSNNLNNISGSLPKSLSCWIKRDGNTNDSHPINFGSDTHDKAFGIWIYPDNNRIQFYGYGPADTNTGVRMADDTWYHFVATYDGSELNVYVNGVLKATKTRTLNTAVSKLTIGARNDNTKKYKGGIDEVGIWNRALTVDEISLLYNDGNGLSYNNF